MKKSSNFFRILADDRLSSSLDVTCPEMPITKRSLIDLPEDYTDLLNKATAYECPNWSTDRKSKSFAICLTCGDLVCYEVKLNYGFSSGVLMKYGIFLDFFPCCF